MLFKAVAPPMKNNEEENEGVKTYVSIYTIHHEKFGNYLQRFDTYEQGYIVGNS